MQSNKLICRVLIVCAIIQLALATKVDACDDAFEKFIAHATKKSQQKSQQKFRRPRKTPNADFDYGSPPEARGPVYSEALTISSKASFAENEGTGFIAFPRRGTAWEKCRIFFQSETENEFDEHEYSPDLVKYGSPDIKPALPKRIPNAVRHWTEVGIFTSLGDGFPQLVNMRANGYMRIASANCCQGKGSRLTRNRISAWLTSVCTGRAHERMLPLASTHMIVTLLS